eukprot:CAMPEP_0118945822 /NCGR_PEP_ID=MMETSP1169-20130426/43047_1 /TAXON_ID=36882 /ORGANISM="Pyramimonas obovata, Strain CCMP722" /LENGTH=163 /DNA_ID=CAMNT_0006891625 /DNA_START=40 /DNA_END=527 /DNA_ORIENTATION=+
MKGNFPNPYNYDVKETEKFLVGDCFGDRTKDDVVRSHTAIVSRATHGSTWLAAFKRKEYLHMEAEVGEMQVHAHMDFCCRLPIFRSLSITMLKDVVEHMSVAEFHRGDTIFQQGAESGTIYFIIEGSVELVKEVQSEAPKLLSLAENALTATLPKDDSKSNVG